MKDNNYTSEHRTESEENIIKTNLYDYLTGLPGMSYFFDLCISGKKSMLKVGDQPVLLFFNLSGMKYYNEKFGFAEGDKLIKSFAEILALYFGKNNCSRFGQDHFAVLTKEDGLEDMLNWLFREWAGKREKNIPVKVGIYKNSMGDVDIGTACDRAKLACDMIKKSHSSSYGYFNFKLLNDMKKSSYIIENIDKAIREKWIKVYYQPIVRAVSGMVCDEEALARWNDPENGMMSPGDFIPVLEDSGLIYKLDLYVLEQVLEKLKYQEIEGLPLVPQSVNLSRTDFNYLDMVEEIRRRVDDAGISRDLITIEITESVLGKDFVFMKTQVERFQRLGFCVWMDDFGSGYSSLEFLQSIKFQLIKFDMKFMQRFDEGDNGKIILTELMKMAAAIGVDTVSEGVETEEQVKFLLEIGCSKLQGFYFNKPIPPEKIVERYKKGGQIGFEDRKQSGYYDAIGRVNLYDLAVLTEGNDNGSNNIYNTLPMAIIEVSGDNIRFVRSNKTYRLYALSKLGINLSGGGKDYKGALYGHGTEFMDRITQCGGTECRAFFDEVLPDGSSVHSFARKIGTNPETGAVAVAIAVLSIKEPDKGATYANIARALAADYFDLFYVDLETDKFIHYSSDVGGDKLAEERHGEDFFNASRNDALSVMYPEDAADFVKIFTKENVLSALNEHGVFALTYRQYIGGVPTYVNMKATRMLQDGRYLIIGVSSAESQMKQKELLDRVHDDQIAYSRLMALSGNYICLYTVDPSTGNYSEYEASGDYKSLGFSKEGEDFFTRGIIDGKRTVYKEDLPGYLKDFSKDNILDKLEKNGRFELCYRLVIENVPVPVALKAVKINENGVEKLIVGIIKTGAVKKSRERIKK